MARNIQDAKAYLTAHSKNLVEALVRMVKSPQVAASVRLKAIETALDRIGLPALRASITQTVQAGADFGSLQETKAELLARQKELAERIAQLQPGICAPAETDRELRNARETSQVLPYTEGPLGDP
jgi:hypothetical protein